MNSASPDPLAALQAELSRQRRLADAAYALHTTLDLGELLQIILDSAREGVSADRGTVFLISEDGKEIWSRVLQGDNALEIRLPMGKGIAGAVAETSETIRVADAYDDDRFDRSWDIKSGYRTRQILCAPIQSRTGRTVGVFQLINRTAEGDFGEIDEDFLKALSVHVALAIENAQLHHSAIEKERQDREIALVQNVQRTIQPEERATETEHYEACGLNFLCEDASGDYYDMIELADGRLMIVIGDVSGHGLHSALVMAQARAFLHAVRNTVTTPDQVLGELNEFLGGALSSGRFMTFFLALAEPDGTVRWGSGGHLPSYHRHVTDGSLDAMASTGPVLGIIPGVTIGEGKAIKMAPGDTLTLYTDGVTEAAGDDGEMFRDTRLEDVLREHGGDKPRAVLAAIENALHAFTGREERGDDLTLLSLRRK